MKAKIMLDEAIKKQARKLHRELWGWLSHHPSKKKTDWPRWQENGGDIPHILNDCFACDFYECETCPCDWVKGAKGDGKVYSCLDPLSSYIAWSNAKSPKTRKKYAEKIRDAWKK